MCLLQRRAHLKAGRARGGTKKEHVTQISFHLSRNTTTHTCPHLPEVGPAAASAKPKEWRYKWNECLPRPRDLLGIGCTIGEKGQTSRGVSVRVPAAWCRWHNTLRQSEMACRLASPAVG